MTTEPELPDLDKLEARLLAERQAYYDRVAAQRSSAGGDDQDPTSEQGLDEVMQERLQRLLGPGPALR